MDLVKKNAPQIKVKEENKKWSKQAKIYGTKTFHYW